MQGEEEDFYIPMHAPGISAKNLDGLTAPGDYVRVPSI
jgi:hypothetical protein